MEPITVKAYIYHSVRLPGPFLARCSYELVAQGDTDVERGIETVKESVESMIVTYLDFFLLRHRPLPRPEDTFLMEGFQLEERVERHYKGLPPLIFEYYRHLQN